MRSRMLQVRTHGVLLPQGNEPARNE